MKYCIDIYKNNVNNSARFLLGTTGKKPLFVVGLNPSTADDKKPDKTIAKIINFTEKAHFDSFVMLNLYAQRTPFPSQLDSRLNVQLHQANLRRIRQYLCAYKSPSILAAWGTPITIRPYLIQCLIEIKAVLDPLKPNWVKIGNLTLSGHPRHPSRAAYALGFMPFDLTSYLSVQKVPHL